MIRHLKIARDTAVKSRSQAMVTLSYLTGVLHCFWTGDPAPWSGAAQSCVQVAISKLR
ncbi:hypothetical protein SAMN06265221_12838 [Paracoccus laeviglucosivorans]|uniref:Uncharacterized protein n=2 Tax=Paracoccus laeviglucosivorans TaxID=1197861 RepID=A0A521FN46_9RHOB|nr:hypothetical protein SAMN06265221_12838 [Paracoccus laeviglucosivorans]